MLLSKLFKKTPKQLYTVAFYNVENLFDTKQNSTPLDTDFIPSSKKQWNTKRYEQKLNKIASVISKIGTNQNTHAPVAIGLAEVENEFVLKDLLATTFLKDKGYGYIHFNSPDERGIDTAFLYRKKYIKILNAEAHEIIIKTPENLRDYTRDSLQISCSFLNENITFLVNHWPSRRDGSTSTSYKRQQAAEQTIKIINAIKNNNETERFIIMGDFNDDPQDESVKKLTQFGLFNPMSTLIGRTKGTTKYKGVWNLFDQILISYEFLKSTKAQLYFKSAAIYSPAFLKQQKGRYKGSPYRTFGGKTYTGGYSDHFPVYLLLEKVNNKI